jgi:uncharacterized membrane protein YjjP (DUF1212 family)
MLYPTAYQQASQALVGPSSRLTEAAADLWWLGLAVAALLICGAVVTRRDRRPGRSGSHAGTAFEDVIAPDKLGADSLEDPTLPFLVALGEAMIDAATPVTQVVQSLSAVARVNGRPDTELIVLSTALMVSTSDGQQIQTAASAAGSRSLTLAQIDAVFDIVSDAERGDITPAQGIRRLRMAREVAPAFTPMQRSIGYVAMAMGLALVLHAGWIELALTGLLGAGVGTVLRFAGRLDALYRPFVPVACSLAVSIAVFALADTSADIGVVPPLVAPLVMFLPGALLTTAVIELATGEMISGAGRLAAGAMQLVLLAVGIVAGAQVVGVRADSIVEVSRNPLGVAAPWLGVAVFGVGAVVHLCARPTAAPWILLVLYVAYAGQVAGGAILGPALSGFCGAMLMTPFAVLIATRPTGPYPFVSFLPAFWLLVPGALGLVGVSQILADNRVDGTSTLLTTVVAMVGIALGVLLGLGIASAASAIHIRRAR